MSRSTEPGPHTYVIVGPRGLAYVGLHDDEPDAWATYFGWPPASEIVERKSAGWYCARAELKWTMPPTPSAGMGLGGEA